MNLLFYLPPVLSAKVRDNTSLEKSFLISSWCSLLFFNKAFNRKHFLFSYHHLTDTLDTCNFSKNLLLLSFLPVLEILLVSIVL